MDLIGLYAALLGILLPIAATSLCLAIYGVYGLRPAFWLSLLNIGLFFYGLGLFSVQLAILTKELPSAHIPPVLSHFGFMGNVLWVYSLPHFFLSVFGTKTRLLYRCLLVAATVAIALLGAVELARGWADPAQIPPLVPLLDRVITLGVIGLSSLLVLAFQSRLPDRNLYRNLVAQLVALVFLLPLIVLEDLGILRFPGFPNLGFLVAMGIISILSILHARSSLTRPRYIEGGAPSRYFIDRFGISERELEVVEGVLRGLGNKEIADILSISPKTVENHLYRVYQKAGISNRIQLSNLFRADAE